MSYGIFRYRPRIVPKRNHYVYYFSPTKQVTALPYKMNAEIKHFMTLNYGDKIKVVAKTINGNTVRTTSQGVRIRIRKKQQ